MKRSPMKKKPPRNGRVPEDVYQAVMWRNGGRCEAGLPGVCTGQAQEFHHRQSRSATRDPHKVVNGAALCSACHHHITHVSPLAGRQRGLIVSRHFTGDQAVIPMKVKGRGLVMLTPSGEYGEVRP